MPQLDRNVLCHSIGIRISLERLYLSSQFFRHCKGKSTSYLEMILFISKYLLFLKYSPHPISFFLFLFCFVLFCFVLFCFCFVLFFFVGVCVCGWGCVGVGVCVGGVWVCVGGVCGGVCVLCCFCLFVCFLFCFVSFFSLTRYIFSFGDFS